MLEIESILFISLSCSLGTILGCCETCVSVLKPFSQTKYFRQKYKIKNNLEGK